MSIKTLKLTHIIIFIFIVAMSYSLLDNAKLTELVKRDSSEQHGAKRIHYQGSICGKQPLFNFRAYFIFVSLKSSLKMKTLRSYSQFYLFLSPVKQKSEHCRVYYSFLALSELHIFYVVCLVEWDKAQNTLTPAFKTHTHTHTEMDDGGDWISGPVSRKQNARVWLQFCHSGSFGY